MGEMLCGVDGAAERAGPESCGHLFALLVLGHLEAGMPLSRAGGGMHRGMHKASSLQNWAKRRAYSAPRGVSGGLPPILPGHRGVQCPPTHAHDTETTAEPGRAEPSILYSLWPCLVR